MRKHGGRRRQRWNKSVWQFPCCGSLHFQASRVPIKVWLIPTKSMTSIICYECKKCILWKTENILKDCRWYNVIKVRYSSNMEHASRYLPVHFLWVRRRGSRCDARHWRERWKRVEMSLGGYLIAAWCPPFPFRRELHKNQLEPNAWQIFIKLKELLAITINSMIVLSFISKSL